MGISLFAFFHLRYLYMYLNSFLFAAWLQLLFFHIVCIAIRRRTTANNTKGKKETKEEEDKVGCFPTILFFFFLLPFFPFLHRAAPRVYFFLSLKLSQSDSQIKVLCFSVTTNILSGLKLFLEQKLTDNLRLRRINCIKKVDCIILDILPFFPLQYE